MLKTAEDQDRREAKFVEDTVKVVLHVQTQKRLGRHRMANSSDGLDILPVTRPVWVAAGDDLPAAESLPSARQEAWSDLPWLKIEKYNPKPMKKLPPDELITFKTKTDDGDIS